MANDLRKYQPGEDPRGDARNDPPDDGPEPGGDDEDDGDGVHGPSDADLADPVETVIYCPNCKNEVYIDAEQCGVCGHYLTVEGTGDLQWEPRKPLWARIVSGIFLLIALLCVAGLVLMLFRGF